MAYKRPVFIELVKRLEEPAAFYANTLRAAPDRQDNTGAPGQGMPLEEFFLMHPEDLLK